MARTDTKRRVRRVASLFELPAQSLRCAMSGHRWDDPPALDAPGWGPIDAAELRFKCPCGRWKREVVNAQTGELLTRDYGGGTLPEVPESRAAARVVAIAIKREGRAARKS